MNFNKELAKDTVNHLFQYLLIAFLATLLAREFFKDYVDHYVNINYFMIIVIVAGVAAIFLKKEEEKKEVKPATKKGYAFIILLGIIGTVLIFLKIKELGWLAYVISVLGGLIITFLSVMLIQEQ